MTTSVGFVITITHHFFDLGTVNKWQSTIIVIRDLKLYALL